MKHLKIHFHRKGTVEDKGINRSKIESWLISLCTNTAYVHVSISDGVNAIIVSVCGKVVMCREQTLYDLMPDHEMIELPVHDRMDLEAIYNESRHLTQWGLLNHITFGMMHSRSCGCVSIARRALAAGGIRIPRRVTSPVKLMRYLQDNDTHGCKLTEHRADKG